MRGYPLIYLLTAALATGCATSPSYSSPEAKINVRYYSLVAENVFLTTVLKEKPGDITLIVGGDSGYSGTYCIDDPLFICLMLDGVYFAVPKDLDKRIGLVNSSDSIGWTFQGREYTLELDKDRRDFSILGEPFHAWWIRVEIPGKGDAPAQDEGRYLWSSTCGLLAFTQVNEFWTKRNPAMGLLYDEYWAEDKRGFGATAACK